MALVVKDRVLETTTTTGTGTITLAGAQATYQAFSVIGDGNTTYYAIVSQTANEWEVGLGTYTASGTSLTRDTILSSSASGAAVNFSAGLKNVFVTYPSEKSVYLDAIDESNSAVTIGTTAVKLGETTDTLAGLESVEVTQDPTTALQLATKQYVDTLVASGIHFHQPVRVESPINLNATYNNGTAGVGATLTNAGTQAALVIDGITVSVADRVLVYEQTTQTQNGVYVVTDVGSGSTNWVLTRASDADTYVIDSPDGLSEGSTFFVQQGTTGAGETYTCNTQGTIVFGTTNITFSQISSAQIYSAGTGLTLAGTQFSITNTAVTPAAYGSASKTLTATVNAQGQLTALADTNIAIGMSQVTSGTLGVTQGGTGFSSYSVGDLIYANTTTSFAKLAGVATGNVLISGGVGAAPLYGKVALASAVSGTLPVLNGGTGVTTSTGSGNVVLSNSPTLVTPALGTPASGNLANCTFPTLNQNTTGNAGSATVLQTARTIGGVSFNGSANINLPGVNTAGNQNTSGNAATATNLSTNQGNWSSNGTISAVVGLLGWKNYGNGHVIFDASNGTSPSGTAVNNTNSQIAWSGTYPTLMGWNGGNTYGVRVDSARLADTGTNWGSYGAVPAPGTSFANANTIGRSDGNGYAYFHYINSNTGNNENPGISQVITTNGGDNFYRKASIGHLTASLSGTAPISISGNATGSTFGFNSGYGSVATAFGCRAWVNFTGSGSAVLVGGGNISSVARGGTGSYTINLTTAMPDTNGAITHGYRAGTNADQASVDWNSTSQIQFSVIQAGTGARDSAENFVAVFR